MRFVRESITWQSEQSGFYCLQSTYPYDNLVILCYKGCQIGFIGSSRVYWNIEGFEIVDL